MKKLLLLTLVFASNTLFSQIVSFHPVKVEANQLESFLEIETNHMRKIAQSAVENGDIEGWRLLEMFNPNPDEYNFMWVNIYKDIKSATSPSSAWWNTSEEVLGIKTSVLMDGLKGIKPDKRYIYEVKLQIENSEPSSYVILNFARPNDVNIQIEEMKKFVVPHFKKNMQKFGMVGWGLGTKITPQGKEYSSMMTWDSYDNLENVMKHLGGYGVIEGLPFDKFSEIIEWENRYIMKVISSTTN